MNNCPPFVKLRILSSLWPPVTDLKWSNRYSAFYAEVEEKSGEDLAPFYL